MSKKDLYTGLGKTLGDNLDWKFKDEQERKVKQVIDNREMVDKLNDLNHDYQRMRKLAKRRRDGILDRINKERAKQERDMRRKLGGEAWIDLKRINVGEACVWIIVGLLLSYLFH